MLTVKKVIISRSIFRKKKIILSQAAELVMVSLAGDNCNSYMLIFYLFYPVFSTPNSSKKKKNPGKPQLVNSCWFLPRGGLVLITFF